MCNEWIFLLHVGLLLGFLRGAACLGKSALISVFSLQAVFANLFVMKQMVLFGLQLTCSDVFVIGAMTTLNALQESFGKSAAKEAIRVSLLMSLLFVAMAQMHLLYLPSPLDQTHGAFEQIFSSTLRIVSASLAVFYIVQRLDVKIFERLERIFRGRKRALRWTLSLWITQAVDTVLFSFLGLYGTVASVTHVILWSFFIKALMILIIVPLSSFGSKAQQQEAIG